MAEPSSDQIHVSPNLEELVNGIESSTRQAQLLREQRDVNDVVHQMLIVGLVVSTALMVFGLALDIFYRRVPPTTVPQSARSCRAWQSCVPPVSSRQVCSF